MEASGHSEPVMLSQEAAALRLIPLPLRRDLRELGLQTCPLALQPLQDVLRARERWLMLLLNRCLCHCLVCSFAAILASQGGTFYDRPCHSSDLVLSRILRRVASRAPRGSDPPSASERLA